MVVNNFFKTFSFWLASSCLSMSFLFCHNHHLDRGQLCQKVVPVRGYYFRSSQPRNHGVTLRGRRVQRSPAHLRSHRVTGITCPTHIGFGEILTNVQLSYALPGLSASHHRFGHMANPGLRSPVVAGNPGSPSSDLPTGKGRRSSGLLHGRPGHKDSQMQFAGNAFGLEFISCFVLVSCPEGYVRVSVQSMEDTL